MPPPPVTPSPHRFVIKKKPPPRKPPLPSQQTPRPSAQQFNATPRFIFSSTPRLAGAQNVPEPTPSASRYLTPARRVLEEDIIEPSSDDLIEHVRESIENGGRDVDMGDISNELEDDYNTDVPSPKRRRISTSPIVEDHRDVLEGTDADHFDSSQPIVSSPPIPRRPISTTAPRFLSTPGPSSTPQNEAHDNPFLKPPRFQPPDSLPAQSPKDPLPEQFSPHRRGQKYVAGGLAAEVRDWLINIDSAVPPSTQKSKDDPWIVRIGIEEISGDGKRGITLVRGRKMLSDEGGGSDKLASIKIILAGEGARTGLQKGAKVEIGKVVGIKGPVWEVVIEGEKWGVGVDWQVLS
ncbi:hypothetical protein B7494_g2267 [Chlorociboria aeruginascens]|nr:hypothetical protein B7494_g2267 [Chlorociboria aeruginascens]